MTLKDPVISIIIPSYNTEPMLLENCISSILEQSYKRFEVIIVDDGSDEKYRTSYEMIKKRDSRIQVVSKTNGGVSSARNYGLKYVLGKYIIFADADDRLTPYFLEEAYNIACNEQADIVMGCNIRLTDYIQDSHTTPIGMDDYIVLKENEIETLIPYMVGKRLAFQNGELYIGRGPWCRLIKRDIAENILFDCNLSICEDVVWNLQVLRKCAKVVYAKRAWYVYNNTQNESATRGYNENAIIYSQMGLSAVRNNLQWNIDEEYRAYCERCLEDISVINSRFIGNIRCKLGTLQKHKLRKKIYTEEPWNVLNSFRFFKLASRTDKIKWILFKIRLLLIIYYVLYKRNKKVG